MVVEARARGDQVRKKMMNERNTGDVERHVKAAAEVVVQRIDYNVENSCSWWTRGQVGREKRLPLAAEADRKNRRGLADSLAQIRIFDH